MIGNFSEDASVRNIDIDRFMKLADRFVMISEINRLGLTVSVVGKNIQVSGINLDRILRERVQKNATFLKHHVLNPMNRLRAYEVEAIAKVFTWHNQIGCFSVKWAPELFVRFYSAKLERNVILAPDGSSDSAIKTCFSRGTELVLFESDIADLSIIPDPKFVSTLEKTILVPAQFILKNLEVFMLPSEILGEQVLIVVNGEPIEMPPKVHRYFEREFLELIYDGSESGSMKRRHEELKKHRHNLTLLRPEMGNG